MRRKSWTFLPCQPFSHRKQSVPPASLHGSTIPTLLLYRVLNRWLLYFPHRRVPKHDSSAGRRRQTTGFSVAWHLFILLTNAQRFTSLQAVCILVNSKLPFLILSASVSSPVQVNCLAILALFGSRSTSILGGCTLFHSTILCSIILFPFFLSSSIVLPVNRRSMLTTGTGVPGASVLALLFVLLLPFSQDGFSFPFIILAAGGGCNIHFILPVSHGVVVTIGGCRSLTGGFLPT